MEFEAGEYDEIVLNTVLMIFMGIFGYAYCTREEEVVEEETIDVTDMQKKEQKTFKKLGEELQKEKEKIARVEEKLKRFEEQIMEKKASNVSFKAKSD